MYIKRTLAKTLFRYGEKFPVVAIMGPRQSGKTTLAKKCFPNHTYVLLEEPDEKYFAEQDPRGFIEARRGERGAILDEIQEAPHLLSYIQGIVDRENKPGSFIVTGSQNFMFNQAITQTLAGRVGMLTLLPLSIKELSETNSLPHSPEEFIFKGGYPRIYAQNFLPTEWYPSYIKNYVERDVRQVVSLGNLTTFQRFIRLCAGRIGQLVNLSSLGNDCGISHNTARSWITLLEASYIIFPLQPYYKNFSKRIIKSPKIYFYDTGLACSLLKIQSVEQLADHYLRGGLFESAIISDLIKHAVNQGNDSDIYFWRDSQGNEVDCIVQQETPSPIEIKSGYTINSSFFSGLAYWNKLTGASEGNGYVVYAGDEVQKRSEGTVVSWKKLTTMFDK